ncbi:MAG TPA: PH domain-containing protein [Lachnospiraceae bacterium]|nr:PH domain-containing protein [Lachnospiraceae bacterium]
MIKRNHPLYIVKMIFSIIKSFLLPMVVLFAVNLKELSLVAVIGIAIILLLLMIGHAFLSWKNFTYQVNDDTLIIQKGILGSTKQAISLDKITTINESQELIERIFNLSTFKVDVGSATKGDELKLTLSHTESQLLRSQLLSSSSSIAKSKSESRIMKEDSIQDNSIRISNNDLLKYAVINSNIFLGIIIATAIMQYINDFPFLNDWINSHLNGWTGKFTELGRANLPLGTTVLLILGIILLYLIFTVIVSIISTFLKYYNFTVTKHKDTINIEYGLLGKKSFTLDVNKITAIYTQYGFFGQFMGVSSLKVENIGYGDEKGEIALLFPIIKDGERERLLETLAPTFLIQGKEKVLPSRKAIPSYIIRFTLFPAILATILTVSVDYGYLSFLFVLLLGACAVTSFRKTSIQFDKDSVQVMNGILGRRYSVIKKNHIQTISLSQNPFQKRRGLMNLKYSYQGNILGKVVQIRGVRRDQVERIGITSLGLKEKA